MNKNIYPKALILLIALPTVATHTQKIEAADLRKADSIAEKVYRQKENKEAKSRSNKENDRNENQSRRNSKPHKVEQRISKQILAERYFNQ